MNYDKKQIYSSEIEPVVKNLRALCYARGIPCFMTFAVENKESEGTKYESELVSPEKVRTELADDHISRHINVLNGFHTKLPEEPIILDL